MIDGFIASGRPDDAKTDRGNDQPKEDQMLWTIAVILVMLWLTGLVSGYAMGLFIHVLFAAAVALLVVSLSQEVTMNRKLRQVLDSRGQKPDYKRKRRKIVMDKPIPAAGIIGLSE